MHLFYKRMYSVSWVLSTLSDLYQEKSHGQAQLVMWPEKLSANYHYASQQSLQLCVLVWLCKNIGDATIRLNHHIIPIIEVIFFEKRSWQACQAFDNMWSTNAPNLYFFLENNSSWARQTCALLHSSLKTIEKLSILREWNTFTQN